MDRALEFKIKHCPTMCAGRFVSLGALLHSSRRNGRKSGADAPARRAIYAYAVLWRSENAPMADPTGLRCQSKESATAFTTNGIGSDLRKATIVKAGARTSNLSLSIARPSDCTTQSSMGHGHHLHSSAARFCVSGGHYGLVQQVRPFMGVVGHAGCGFLFGSVGMGIENGKPGNLQFRSGIPIHKRAIHKAAARARRPDQHGWARPGDGQHLRGTSMADHKIRRSLSEGLQECSGGCREPSELFLVLQRRTHPPVFGISDSSRGLFPKAVSDSNFPGTDHGHDWVAVRSSIVGQYRANIFRGNPVKHKMRGSEPIGSLEKP